MTIASKLFFLLFLPLSLVFYWGISKKSNQKLWLLCALSYLFYALADWSFVPLLIGLSLATFLLARVGRYGLGIALNLAALTYFKYWNFGITTLNSISVTTGSGPLLPIVSIALPLGISFYIFKHVGYLLDVRQKRYPPTEDFLAFATFSAFFPQIGAGPISSFQDTGRQLRALPQFLGEEGLYQGLVHISMGLAKKVLIADPLRTVIQSQLSPQLQIAGMMNAWLLVLTFGLQLYFDFSGYSDLALGIAYLFGVKLPANFNNPYLATQPSDFWQRWHISLSAWFRAYLFVPLSRALLKRMGSQRSELAHYTANMVTMTLVGFWHGAAWTYIIWGAYHGLLLNVDAWTRRRHFNFNLPLLGRILFIFAIFLGWAFFLSPDLASARLLVRNMFGFGGFGTLGDIQLHYTPFTLVTIVVAVLVSAVGLTEAANLPITRSRGVIFLLGLLTALCVLQIGGLVNFTYVQF